MRNYWFYPLSLVSFATFGCSPAPSTNDAGADANDSVDSGPTIDVVTCDPKACNSGHCAPDGGCAQGCTNTTGCGAGETCCNNSYCANTAKDPQNCGACGTACGAKQFCSGASCNDALVNSVCQNASGSVVLDGVPVDEDAGTTVGASLTSACSSLKLGNIPQGAPGSMDTNGRPLLGPGNTYVAAGGGFSQKAIGYMNGARNAPVYTLDDGTNISLLRTADNSSIVKAPIISLTTHNDYFVVYAAAEPISGTLVFAVYGLYAPGTVAGAFWFKTLCASKLSTYNKQYYVFQWKDTNNNGVPDAPDTFTLLDSN